MGWGKWLAIGFLILITLPIGGILWIPLLYIGYKWWKLVFKVYLYLLYFTIRIPIWLFIQLPLYYLGYATNRISAFFHRGIASFYARPKTASFFAVITGLLMLFLFPISLSNMMSVESLRINMFSLFSILFGTFILTFILMKIWVGLKGIQIAQKHMPGSRQFRQWSDEKSEQAGAATGAAIGAAAGGVRMYRDLKIADYAGEKGEFKPMMIPQDMKNMVVDAAEGFPGLSGLVGDAGGAAGGAAEGAAGGAAGAAEGAGGAAAAMGLSEFIVALVAVIIVYFFTAFLFAGILYVLTLFIFSMWLPTFMSAIGGPILGAIGLGASYGEWVGQTTQNQYLAGLDFEDELYVYRQARARVFCLLKGPSCLRQWRLNNTVRPGSQDVGETYGLKIDRFEVSQGTSLDIAFKDRSYALPISFTVSNPRHGLKGINAMNVSYRIIMIDSERGEDNPYCDTGWLPVGDDASDDVKAYDIDEDTDFDDIYPGTSASTGFLRIEGNSPGDDISLQDCEMLQPAAGQHRTMILKMRYDYFSQATLYFEAMALETLQSDSSVSKSWKESQTADTPVKAAINVNSPVIFDGGDPQPFAIRATLNTDKPDVDYRVKELTVAKSFSTEIRTAGGNCQFNDIGGDKMVLTNSAKELIIYSEFSSDKQDSLPWFTANRPPPIFGCVMQLKSGEISSISPTGETLTMGVKSNYTVSKRERIGSFKVYSSRCAESGINCPLIVTAQQNFSDTSYPYRTECEGLDAGNGCSIVHASSWDPGGSIKPIRNRDQNSDSRISPGDVAVELSSFSGTSPDPPKGPFGMRTENWEKVHDGHGDWHTTGDGDYEGYAVIHYKNRQGRLEAAYEPLEYALIKKTGDCSKAATKSEFLYNWTNVKQKELVNPGTLEVWAFEPNKVDCEVSSGFWDWLFSLFGDGTTDCPPTKKLVYDVDNKQAVCYPR